MTIVSLAGGAGGTAGAAATAQAVGTLGTSLSAVGTGFSAYGMYQQGQFQSDVAKNNAFVQNWMRKDALARGEKAEADHRMKTAQLKSDQRARFAASGVNVDTGSAARVQADTAMLGELDALTIRSNFEREAYGHSVGASNYSAQADLDETRGRRGAVSTILTGAGQVASNWKPAA